jgi:RNA recognition motif-containing protein
VAKNVYVGNLSFDTTQDRLQELFEAHGEVVSVNVITDRMTGRPRGFAFVEMATEEAAKAAIAALNGQEVDGRTLNVDEARPRPPRSGGRSGGRGRGSGGYDRGRRDRWD